MFCPNTINIISYHRKKSIVLLNPGARVLDDSLLVHGLTGRFHFRIIVSKPTRPDGYLETLADPEAQTTSTMKDSLLMLIMKLVVGRRPPESDCKTSYNNGLIEAASQLSGLGSRYWTEVIEVLRTIIPFYDKVNRVISLGRDEEYRLRGIRGRVMPGNMILDAGSGYGNMSRLALEEARGDAKVVMYDPLLEMLANVNNYLLGSQAVLCSGVFEYMPFRDGIFDAVLCGYSLRDSIHLRQAIKEMHRVLKFGGRLVIIDLGKPDNPVFRAMVSVYLKYFLAIFAYLAAGKAGLKFKTLYGTYLRWPKNSEIESLLKEKFSHVQFDTGMMGGAVIIAAHK